MDGSGVRTVRGRGRETEREGPVARGTEGTEGEGERDLLTVLQEQGRERERERERDAEQSLQSDSDPTLDLSVTAPPDHDWMGGESDRQRRHSTYKRASLIGSSAYNRDSTTNSNHLLSSGPFKPIAHFAAAIGSAQGTSRERERERERERDGRPYQPFHASSPALVRGSVSHNDRERETDRDSEEREGREGREGSMSVREGERELIREREREKERERRNNAIGRLMLRPRKGSSLELLKSMRQSDG
ncbi:hypothetical protein KIPB_007431 [Kipferlia bialata]|uniref:Uncharacterized protein n=1 Tax=Kipferlia bialata TaxID=797122 RepID=A0A9K3D095_9EUKA|nr:hypothetical protein KIPB_007431 [Kipferlia bialata]|eukprot:g7431.t1